VKNHYAILEDTLIGFTVPAYVLRQKRRVVNAPKFYFANVGVVNHLAKRRHLEEGSDTFGKAFENWIVNEIRTYNTYKEKRWDLAYWRLSSGGEVDLVVNDAEYAFEIKSSKRISSKHLKGLRDFSVDNPKTKQRTLICLERQPSRTEDGIDILPAEVFLDRLWGDDYV
jgi:predicted AAA+ superfamily ATPase